MTDGAGSTPTERLAALGIVLPLATAPVGSFINATQVGPILYVSGHTAWGEGRTGGLVGSEMSIEDAYANARAVGLRLLTSVVGALGSLDRVKRVVKVNGMVRASADFADHPRVINGCSDLLEEVFGDAGRHARTSIGVASLPFCAPVEIEALFEVA
jgi:enamine deaminase RidA (YjgF/YER057c/UK114 family)